MKFLMSLAISECSKEGTKTAPLDVQPLQAVGAITIKGKATKHARTSEPAGAAPSPPVGNGKKAVEHLSSVPDNELLNTAEVTVESMPTSVARMLCQRMFRGSLMLLTPTS